MNIIDETIRDYGYVNFKPAKEEEWSIYKLDDGTIIKLKSTPLKFLKKGNDIFINPMVLVVPFAPEGRRKPLESKEEVTPQLPLTESELMVHVDKLDVKVEVSKNRGMNTSLMMTFNILLELRQ